MWATGIIPSADGSTRRPMLADEVLECLWSDRVVGGANRPSVALDIAEYLLTGTH
jgi:hypothetical protein